VPPQNLLLEIWQQVNFFDSHDLPYKFLEFQVSKSASANAGAQLSLWRPWLSEARRCVNKLHFRAPLQVCYTVAWARGLIIRWKVSNTGAESNVRSFATLFAELGISPLVLVGVRVLCRPRIFRIEVRLRTLGMGRSNDREAAVATGQPCVCCWIALLKDSLHHALHQTASASAWSIATTSLMQRR
jgi:hypothetical protein